MQIVDIETVAYRTVHQSYMKKRRRHRCLSTVLANYSLLDTVIVYLPIQDLKSLRLVDRRLNNSIVQSSRFQEYIENRTIDLSKGDLEHLTDVVTRKNNRRRLGRLEINLVHHCVGSDVGTVLGTREQLLKVLENIDSIADLVFKMKLKHDTSERCYWCNEQRAKESLAPKVTMVINGIITKSIKVGRLSHYGDVQHSILLECLAPRIPLRDTTYLIESLEHIAISVDMSLAEHQHQAVDVLKSLESSQKLRSLELRISNEQRNFGCPLTQYLLSLQFPYLSEVRLCNFAGTEDQLRDFIRKHSGLTKIKLETYCLPRWHSWRNVFDVLENLPSLSYLYLWELFQGAEPINLHLPDDFPLHQLPGTKFYPKGLIRRLITQPRISRGLNFIIQHPEYPPGVIREPHWNRRSHGKIPAYHV